MCMNNAEEQHPFQQMEMFEERSESGSTPSSGTPGGPGRSMIDGDPPDPPETVRSWSPAPGSSRIIELSAPATFSLSRPDRSGGRTLTVSYRLLPEEASYLAWRCGDLGNSGSVAVEVSRSTLRAELPIT